MPDRKTAAPADALTTYRAKRDFTLTPEPSGDPPARTGGGLVFVVQKHAATRLHYDFRLELDGVMLSWAVPKGPSYDPADKRMAVRTEDHPISYNTFEGTIPPGQYGAGTVIVWDRGTWVPVGDPRQGLRDGKLAFELHGHKLAGAWELIRIAKGGERQVPWLLFKKRDGHARARADYDVVAALPDSIVAKPLPLLTQPPAAGRTEPAAGAAPVLGGARKAALPARLEPQLATLADGLPAGGDWSFEIKLDGYRLLTRIEGGKPRLITRGGHDWTLRMGKLASELSGLKLRSAWLDGEIVVLDDRGVPNFGALQNAFDGRSDDRIVYFIFDVPYFEGHDLREVPLRERRALLAQLLAERGTERLRFSADFTADPAAMLESAQRLGLEGLIAKRADAPYVSARTATWLKLKCRQRQEFVVGGYTDRSDNPGAAEIGSLLLGVHDDAGRLVSVGSVGTGWDGTTAAALKQLLLPLRTDKPPFDAAATPKKGRWSRRPAGSERWVRPETVVEVSFSEWTSDAQVRHAKFEGVRLDKPAGEVRREVAAPPPGAAATAPRAPAAARAAGPAVVVSNPGRVIDASTGITKLDLVRYYESVADWLVPHLKGRPCSLVRGPSGIDGELFFQKHADKLRIPDVVDLDPALWPGHDALLEVPSARAVAGAAQMNVIEFHTWNAKAARIDTPDRMVFDLDPGEGVTWKQVQEAAVLTRSLLEDLGLRSWLKTSGGKGLHVVVPLAPRDDWTAVKAFSQAVVQHLARVIPSRFVAKSGGSNRVGRIFVDYLRNSHGATTATAYSARARPGLGVSMPVEWDALAELKSGAQWTVRTAREHLSFQRSDPWADYAKSRQTLARARKALAAAARPGVV